MQQPSLDLFGPAPRVVTGRQLKRRGQQAALLRAGTIWRHKIMQSLKGWLKMRDETGDFRTTIVFEDFREYAEQFQSLRPASTNAWGSLPRMALAADLISATGQTTKSRRKDAHGRLVRVWAVKL